MDERLEIRASAPAESYGDVLTAILRRGAPQLLLQAIEAEIDQYIPARTIQSGFGDIEVKAPLSCLEP